MRTRCPTSVGLVWRVPCILKTMRRFFIAPAIAILACSSPLAPGDYLVGSWSSPEATFAATSTSVTLQLRCIEARFGPIRLTDSLMFTATGVVTEVVIPLPTKVGDPYALSGRLEKNLLMIGTLVLPQGTGYQRPACDAAPNPAR